MCVTLRTTRKKEPERTIQINNQIRKNLTIKNQTQKKNNKIIWANLTTYRLNYKKTAMKIHKK